MKFQARNLLAPYEILALAWAGIAYWILESLPAHFPVWEMIRQSTVSFRRYILITVIVSLCLRMIRARKEQGGWGKQLWRIDRATMLDALEALRIFVAIILAAIFHFLVKSSVYLINPRTYDAQLFELDRTLHLGISPSLFAVTLFNSPAFYHAIDVFYSLIYGLIVMSFPPLVVVLGTRRIRSTFATALNLLLILGICGYIAFPSWGPVFTRTQDFEEALAYMPLTVAVQTQLHTETSALVKSPLGARSIRFGGIAAFPSLHLAVLTLWALTSRKISRHWFHLNLLFLAFMLIGSLVTGYHYLIDGYAGILLGWAAFRMAEWWVARVMGPEQDPGTTIVCQRQDQAVQS